MTSMMRKGYADTRFGQIHYRVSGHSTLPALMLVHQTASSGAQFERVMALLQDAFFCIAPDIPGFGSSDETPEPPTISDYTEALREMANMLGVHKLHFFGHHTGAAIGVDWAAQRPQDIATLALSGPPLLSPALIQRFADRALPPAAAPADGAHLQATWHLLRARSPHLPQDVLQREVLLTLGARNQHHSYAACFAQDFAGQLASVCCPILLMAGRNDSLWDSLHATHALVPQASLAILDDSDAYVSDTHAKLLADTLADFFAVSF